MTINTIENYVHTKKIDLNLTNMKLSSYQMYYHIKKTFVPGQNDYSGHSTLTTQLFTQYNLFLYPVSSEFHSYWNMGKDDSSKRFINEQKKISNDKLVFLKVISNVIKSGMDIVGVDTPQKM